MANSLEEFINQNSGPTDEPSPDVAPAPIEQFADDVAKQTNVAAKQNYTIAADTDPDRFAQIQKLSKKNQLPVELVESNFDELSKADKIDSFDTDALGSSNPGLTTWLANPDNAKIAHDDTEALKEIEDLVGSHTVWASTKRMFDIGSKAGNIGVLNVAKGITQLPALAVSAVTFPQNFLIQQLGLEKYGIPQAVTPDWLINNPLALEIEKQKAQFDVPELHESVTDAWGKGEILKGTEVLWAQLLANAPQQMANIFATVLSGGVGIGAGLAFGSAGAEALQTATDEGQSPADVGARALGHGALEAGMEAIGTLGILKGWQNKIASKYGAATTREILSDFAKTVTHSFMGEASEEFMTSISQDYVSFMTGDANAMKGSIQRALDAGVIGGFSGGTMTAPSATLAGLVRGQEMYETKRLRDLYTALGTSAESAKLRERAPEAQRDFIDSIAKGTGIETVAITEEEFEQYSQSVKIPAVQLAAQLGVTNEYNEAVKTGDMLVPLGTWTEKVVGTEHYEGLADHVRLDPEKPSFAMARKERQAVAQAEAESSSEAQTQEEKINSVEARFDAMLRAAKADPKAAGVARAIGTLAIREGMEPSELLASLGIEITTPEGTSAELETDEPQAQAIDVTNASDEELVNFFGSRQNIERLEARALKRLGNAHARIVAQGDKASDADKAEYQQTAQQIERIQKLKESMPHEEAETFNQSESALKKEARTRELSPLGFFSAVSDAIDQIDFKSMPGTDLFNRLKNQAGIKKEELEYLDLENFLTGFEGKISKEAVLEYVKQRGVRVDQVVGAEGFKQVTANSDKKLVDDVSWSEEPSEIPEVYYENEADFYLDESGNFDDDRIEFEKEMREELRTELVEEYTDENGEIDETGLAAEIDKDVAKNLESKFREKFYQSAYEMAVTSVNENWEEKIVTEETTGWSLTGSDDQGWYSNDTGDSYSGNLEEAKLKLIDAMVENGLLAYEKALPKASEISWTSARDLAQGLTYSLQAETEALEDIDIIQSEEGDFALSGPGLDASLAATTLEEAKAEVIGILQSENLIQPNDDTPAQEKDINAPTDKTYWKSYTVPGAANYREVLLTLPDLGPEKFHYSTHRFPSDNILAHIRVSDRVTADGKKMLFIEELQSDWHQQGRDKGYKEKGNEARKQELYDKRGVIRSDLSDASELLISEIEKDPEYTEFPLSKIFKELVKGDRLPTASNENLTKALADYTKIKNENGAIGDEITALENAVPDAPFKNTETWAQIAMKRAIRLAVEQGYDVVGWTPGAVHAERWGTDSVSWQKKTDENGEIHWLVGSVEQQGGLADGTNIEEMARARGALLERSGEVVRTKEQLREVISSTLNRERNDKSLESLTEQIWTGMQTQDAGIKQPRREGLEFFYDNMMTKKAAPAALKGMDKSAKVGVSKITTNPDESMDVWSLPITDAIKESTKNGMPLFQKDDKDIRGQIKIGKKRISIALLEKADPSTFIHEMGHLYLEILTRLNARENATEETKRDMKTLLNWFGLTDVSQIGVDQHEMFARGFEKFIGEGHAPTTELRKVFKRFQAWIMKAYTDLTRLNVDLTDEVRDVFTRMFVANETVTRKSIESNQGPLFGDPASVGMNEKQALDYRRADQNAQDFARSQLQKKLASSANRKRTKAARAQRAIIEKDVRAQVESSNVYNAISILQSNEKADGTKRTTPGFKLDPNEISDEERKILPKGIYDKDTGVHPDIAAKWLGFASGNELLDSMQRAPTKEALIEKTTDERMAAEFPDLVNDSQIDESAIDALHNAERSNVIYMELQHLASNNLKVLGNVVKKLTRRLPTQKDVRRDAESIISNKKLRDIKPHVYHRAEVKAAKEAGELFAKGDIDGAFKAKQRELLNHELYRAAKTAQESVENSLTKFKAITKTDKRLAKTRDIDMVNAARAVLAEYGIGPAARKTVAEHLAKIQTYDPDSYATIKALVDMVKPVGGQQTLMPLASNYKDATFQEFSDMEMSVTSIWELAKSSKEVEIDGVKRNRDELSLELQDRLALYSKEKTVEAFDSTASDKEKRTSSLLGGVAALSRVEHRVEAYDVTANGPFRRYIWNPMSEAITRYRLRKETVITKLKEIYAEHSEIFTQDEIIAKELGFKFKNKAELLMALLHTGNLSNKQKLLRGYGWGEMDFDSGILDTSRWDAFIERMHKEKILTKADYDFAQAIWDLNETLKPDAQKAHKKVNGYYFNEITFNEITTPFGTFKGGYIPAKADTNKDDTAAARKAREQLEQSQPGFIFPTTGSGFTKTRNEAHATKLSLEMNLLGAHIDSVLRFSFIEPTTREIGRLLNDKAFRKAMSEESPRAIDDMFMPWLLRSASQQKVIPSDTADSRMIDAAARVLRNNVAMQFMMGNLSNTLQQFTGLFVAMAKVKPRHMRTGLMTYLASPRKTSEDILSKSDFMRATQGSTIGESNQAIREIIVNPTTFQSIAAFANKHTYFLQSAAQNMVNNITWIAAYNQAYENSVLKDPTLIEQEAVRAADSAVRLTQGTNNPEDISAYETGTATKQLFTQFAGYFNMLANLNASELQKINRELGLKKGSGKMFALVLTTFTIPAVLSALIAKGMAGKLGDEDDDDEYWDDFAADFFSSQFKTATAMVPIAGPLAVATYNHFNKQQYDDRLSLSPVLSVLESAAAVPAKILKIYEKGGEASQRDIKDIFMLVGLLTGTPAYPIAKPLTYLRDVAQGEAQPTGPIDFTRGLITGQKGQ